MRLPVLFRLDFTEFFFPNLDVLEAFFQIGFCLVFSYFPVFFTGFYWTSVESIRNWLWSEKTVLVCLCRCRFLSSLTRCFFGSSVK